mmetsp:Transcript_22993/g.51857  ORF Transcript_22993/g.51857 Transcript_22993/m.51857 type:complete len:204 (-) Transcript_22993:44-655(-)
MEAKAELVAANPGEAAKAEDEAQATQLLDALLHRPDELKKWIKEQPHVQKLGLDKNEKETDESIEQLRGIAQRNEAWARWFLVETVRFMRRVRAAYAWVDAKSGGYGGYIAFIFSLAVVFAGLWFMWVVGAWIFRNTIGRLLGWGTAAAGATASTSSAAEPSLQEFQDGGAVGGLEQMREANSHIPPADDEDDEFSYFAGSEL